MPRKYAKSRRTMRRRRLRSRFRRRTRRVVPGLRYYKHKFVQVVEVGEAFQLDPLISGTYQFFWMQKQKATPLNRVQDIAFDKCPRWPLVFPNYEQFAVTGMKVKWHPSNVRGVVQKQGEYQNVEAMGVSAPHLVYDDINSNHIFDLDRNNVIARDSFKMRDPTRTYKIFRGCKKLARQQQVKWQNTDNIGDQLHVPNATTAIRVITSQEQTTNTVNYGFWKVTYYVTFRGIRRELPQPQPPEEPL